MKSRKNKSIKIIMSIITFISYISLLNLNAQEQLNPNNITLFADKLSTQEQKQITDFFKAHEKEIKPLAQLKGFVIWKKVFDDNNKNLASIGLKNIQDTNQNYGFQIPDTLLTVEIAGPGNRWQNIVQHFDRMGESDKYSYAISLGNDVDANKALLKKMREEIETEYKNKPVATHQAISRIYLGKALAQHITDKNLKNIK